MTQTKKKVGEHMSRRNNLRVPDRIEIKVLIVRNYKNQKDFCEKNSISYINFRHFLAGNNTYTSFNKRLEEIMIEHGYDPYAYEKETEEPLKAAVNK